MIKIAVFVIGAGVALVVYGVILKNYLAIYAQATDKSAIVSSSTGFTKLWAILQGWKALICTWIAGLMGIVTAIPAETLQGWATLPWSGVVDQKIASGIAIAFSLLAGIFHVQTAATAAKTAPQDGS